MNKTLLLVAVLCAATPLSAGKVRRSHVANRTPLTEYDLMLARKLSEAISEISDRSKEALTTVDLPCTDTMGKERIRRHVAGIIMDLERLCNTSDNNKVKKVLTIAYQLLAKTSISRL